MFSRGLTVDLTGVISVPFTIAPPLRSIFKIKRRGIYKCCASQKNDLEIPFKVFAKNVLLNKKGRVVYSGWYSGTDTKIHNHIIIMHSPVSPRKKLSDEGGGKLALIPYLS